MYSKDGENYFIVDAHLHMWDASDENQKNVHGAQFIECFYDYHKNLSPEEYVWTLEKYKKYSEGNWSGVAGQPGVSAGQLGEGGECLDAVFRGGL